MPHRFLERAEAELCEQFTHFLGNEHHEVHHMFGFAGEACPELRILRGDTLWAGVLLACAHHHTAFHHKSGGGEAELLRSQQRRDHHVTAGLQFAVALDDDARAKTIENQRLLGFRQTDLPWRAGMADGVERGRSGTAVIAGMSTTSAWHLATPAAMVPTPNSDTSLTCTRAFGLAIFASLMSCLRSSME